MSRMTKVSQKQWTKEQLEAIHQSGQDILVSASAGSGKTAVLVERIINKVMNKEKPVDVNRLLVVTFTNAAATEMRQRIEDRLRKELEENPTSQYLKKQLSLLNLAAISTLHSFCIDIVRKYYFELGVDPRFRIVDTTEAELIREEVIEELFEEEYSSGNKDFIRLADWYAEDRHDLDLQNLVRELYDFSRSHPWSEKWLDQLVESYVDVDIKNNDWIRTLQEDVKIQLEGVRSLLKKALDLSLLPDGPEPYSQTLLDDLAYIDGLINAETWDDMYEAFQVDGFQTLKRVKKDEVNPELQEQVKNLREKAKKDITGLKNELFSRTLEDYIADIKEMVPIVRELVRVTKRYGELYWQKKKEKTLLDFSDLEHLVLKLLNDNETAVQELRNRFDEVLIDEYQDINEVQETILRLISKDDNMFMVGDVKQSIYRFRLAEPSLFLQKYKMFNGDGRGLRIDLANNFRSRKEILDGTNFIFKQLMDESIGGISYDESAELKPGGTHDSQETPIDVLIINRNGTNEEENEVVISEDITSAELEGKVIASKIKNMVGKYQIFDNGQKRSLKYRDIVILLRSFNSAQMIMEELKKQGIPAYAELSTGYFAAVEVQVMISMLKVIDNPYQDIPLVAVLRSPLMGLDEEELAKIRIVHREGPFFDAVVVYAKTKRDELAKKLTKFLITLGQWRKMAREGSLSNLIWRIYRETKYYDFVGSMYGGKQRQANLQALYDRARQYESTSFRGLFRFLRFIERMQERGDDLGVANFLGEQEDVVRLMTIHKSKGLEFPVVFIAAMNQQFNVQDMRGVMLHKKLGFGSRFMDPIRRIKHSTLPQLAIKKIIQRELVAEEMRVLYVAMTRAKEKMILIATLNDVKKSIAAWERQLSNTAWVLPVAERMEAKSYFDWIGPALMRHRDAIALNKKKTIDVADEILNHTSNWYIEIIERSTVLEEEIESIDVDEMTQRIINLQQVQIESDKKAEVNRQLSWSYPNRDAQIKSAKQTVTEMQKQKERYSLATSEELIKHFKSRIADRPRFLRKNNFTATEKGTAMHTVMQHIRLEPVEDLKSYIRNEIARMVAQEILTVDEERVIDVANIVKFFESEIGQQLLRSKNVHREVPFSYALNSKEAYIDWSDEQEQTVLVQGIFDVVIESEEGLVIIDYKTDVVKQSDITSGFERIKNRYALQIDIYKRGIQEIWKKEVKATYLYLFDGGHLVKM